MNGLEERDIRCPYCGESITILVDFSAGQQQYTEDCQVCCNPMCVTVELDEAGMEYLSVTQEND